MTSDRVNSIWQPHVSNNLVLSTLPNVSLMARIGKRRDLKSVSLGGCPLTLSPDRRQFPLVLQLRTVMSAECVGGTACCSFSCLLNMITSPLSHPTARISRLWCQHREVTRQDLSTCVSGTRSPCDGQEANPMLQRVAATPRMYS